MSEKLKSSNERAEELRKELLKLKNTDPDLLVLNSEWVAALGPDELAAFNTLLALQRGVERGYPFERDEIEDALREFKKLSGLVERRKEHMLAEAKKKASGGISERERLNFLKSFEQEDYVALYYDWLRLQFKKFFENNPEYDYAKEEERAVK